MMKANRRATTQLDKKDFYISLYGSQLLLLVIGIALSFFYTGGPVGIWHSLEFQWAKGIGNGSLFAVAALLLNWLLVVLLPKGWLDDGGLNERVFTGMGPVHIVCFCLLVAFCEEWLFRAVLQQLVGLPLASLLFAIVHFRYVTKPVLFAYVLVISIGLGWTFEVTGNFATVVCAHFFINAVLAFVLNAKNRK